MRNKKKRNDYAEEGGQGYTARLCRFKKGCVGSPRCQSQAAPARH